MGEFLRAENAAGRGYFPPGEAVLRAFTYPFEQVRVLILRPYPYLTHVHALCLSFSVNDDVRPIPRSLHSSYREMREDLGIPTPVHGHLTAWARSGVLLLNRSLTVQPGQPASHRGKGWETITDAAIRALVARGTPLVAILWGRDAQSMSRLLGDTPIIASVHPSPLSANRGFFGSRPFSRANALLEQAGAAPIDWRLT